MYKTIPVILLLCFSVAACDRTSQPTNLLVEDERTLSSETGLSAVNEERIVNADSEAHNWLTHGRDYSEQRYSPLDRINKQNVGTLGLAWEADVGSTRGLESTPLVIDGKMYVTSTWSRVIALDAKSGAILWRYDPEVPKAWAKKLCCDIVNRGLAAWGKNLFLGTLDGRLVSLDRETGKLVWEVDTLTDRTKSYSITGAPRVVKDKVIIGNGGAEYGVRGYVSAYDADTGDLAWRFFTVPGDPQNPFENPALEMASKTWLGVEEWAGLGGTAWDSMAYDPELDLLYVGTGNGSPWSRGARSPGGGDNLFLSSILALNPDTGSLQWYYQTTPGDNWDYTATQHMILADLDIDGDQRKVLMQAPKNGFFYVLDRITGELISAEKYVYVNWASHIDKVTGRPVETGIGTYNTEKDAYVFPSAAGAHNWHPMSYSPSTGLVYIPTRDIGWVYTAEDDKWFTYGVDDPQELLGEQQPPKTRGSLKAWDPVNQQLAWEHETPLIWNGGVLSTAGGLVFHGTGEGHFLVLDAETGKTLKKIETGTGMIAPPITYSVGNIQYVAVLAGWGGPAFNTMQGTEAAIEFSNAGRLLVFKLHGESVALPDPQIPLSDFFAPADLHAAPETIEQGRMLYVPNCGSCHGVYGSTPLLPDLRRLTAEKHTIFDTIVRGGILEHNGMASFAQELGKNEVDAIQAYIAQMARDAIRVRSAQNSNEEPDH
jgi:quinohemoprotein ethanol dehydrogenase